MVASTVAREFWNRGDPIRPMRTLRSSSARDASVNKLTGQVSMRLETLMEKHKTKE
jgi:hypothetical protein